MTQPIYSLAALAAVCSVSTAFSEPGTHTPVFDIPYMDRVVVDADSTDWGDSGLEVLLQAAPKGGTLPPDDLDGQMRVGWDGEGLLLLLEITDDVAKEYDTLPRLYRKDSVELFHSGHPGSDIRYQAYVTSGADPAYPEERVHINDSRQDADGVELPPCEIEVAAVPTGSGYRMELRLPWSNLGMDPQPGMITGFQIYLNDADTDTGHPREWMRFSWHPGDRSSGNPDHVHALRLAKVAGSADRVAVRHKVRIEQGRMEIRAIAPIHMAGEQIEVLHGQTVLAEGTFTPVEGRAQAELRAGLPAPGKPASGVVLSADGMDRPIVLGDLDRERAFAFVAQDIVFEPYCFFGSGFPRCDFARPLEAEQLIGPYRFEVAYYDSHYNRVEKPGGTGRFGAVIDIHAADGRTFRRYATLYRQPDRLDWSWWHAPPYTGHMMLPAAEGIHPEVVKAENASVMNHVGRLLVSARRTEPGHAILLAGLSEIEPGEETDFATDVFARDAQWWVTMKRKLYNLEERFPADFTCPTPTDGTAYPVIHEGSLADAGMKPDTRSRIDALCEAWYAASETAFTVCLVRHGVIVQHKGYGMRDGEPMTTETPSWLASITKCLGGTAVMMLVDQGRVDLDEPVSTYLPAFADYPTEPLITVRDLFRHTSGLPNIWPPLVTHIDASMAELSPYAEVRRRWEYNTAVCEVGARVIESASGEALSAFYKKHLLDPLGCENLIARGAGGDATSTAIDLATVGQMLLNKGAYGNMRFFSEDAYERMLPASLDHLPEPTRPWPKEAWGIGTVVMADEVTPNSPFVVFGREPFGHGAASSSTFLVDPGRDLVLVITRNRGGPHFRDYLRRFNELILAQIVE